MNMTTSISTSFRGARRSTITERDGVLSVDLHEHDQLVRGQCFSAHPASRGRVLAEQMCESWLAGADMRLTFDAQGRAR